MGKLTYTIGDATQPVGEGNKVIAHVCNDVGAWGAGFVLAITNRWREPEQAYRKWAKAKDEGALPVFGLGGVQLVTVSAGLYVVNMVAQRGLGFKNGKPPIRYSALRICLAKLALLADEHGASVHMPRIGCGLAGGKWESVAKIIEEELVAKGTQVAIYDLA